MALGAGKRFYMAVKEGNVDNPTGIRGLRPIGRAMPMAAHPRAQRRGVRGESVENIPGISIEKIRCVAGAMNIAHVLEWIKLGKRIDGVRIGKQYRR